MSLDIRTIGTVLVLLILVGLPFGLGNYGYYILAIVMIYAATDAPDPAGGKQGPAA